jgi:hypothetical protein
MSRSKRKHWYMRSPRANARQSLNGDTAAMVDGRQQGFEFGSAVRGRRADWSGLESSDAS